MCRACAEDASLAMTCAERLPEVLRRTYLFADLSAEQLDEALAHSRTVEIKDGRWLYRQGDPADRFFLLRRGRIALFRQSPEGRESIIALVGEGEIFGEDHLHLEEPRYDLHARAVGPCSLASFDRRRFRAFLEGSTALCFRLMATLHRRQQMLLDHIERLTLHDATGRLMVYLMEQAAAGAAPARLKLGVPKSTLASHLSIQPETLSRILARLKECHYLREEGDDLVLLDTAFHDGAHCALCRLRSWGCPGPRGELAADDDPFLGLDARGSVPS